MASICLSDCVLGPNLLPNSHVHLDISAGVAKIATGIKLVIRGSHPNVSVVSIRAYNYAHITFVGGCKHLRVVGGVIDLQNSNFTNCDSVVLLHVICITPILLENAMKIRKMVSVNFINGFPLAHHQIKTRLKSELKMNLTPKNIEVIPGTHFPNTVFRELSIHRADNGNLIRAYVLKNPAPSLVMLISFTLQNQGIGLLSHLDLKHLKKLILINITDDIKLDSDVLPRLKWLHCDTIVEFQGVFRELLYLKLKHFNLLNLNSNLPNVIAVYITTPLDSRPIGIRTIPVLVYLNKIVIFERRMITSLQEIERPNLGFVRNYYLQKAPDQELTVTQDYVVTKNSDLGEKILTYMDKTIFHYLPNGFLTCIWDGLFIVY